MTRTFKSTIAVLTICFSALMSFAKEPPSLEVELESEEVLIGEAITLQIAVHNTDQPTPPSTKPLEESFDVTFRGEQSLNQSSATIFNGRLSRQEVYKHIYQYRVTPKLSGLLTIPALTTTVDGVEIKSKPLRLLVVEPAPQDDVLLEIVSNQDSVYPTQSFEVTLRILVRKLPDSNEDPLKPLKRRPPHLDVPWVETPEGLVGQDKNTWLRTLLSDRGYGFTMNEINTSGGFMFENRSAVFDLLTGKEKRTSAQGETIEYFRYELTQKYQATKSGEFQFGPAMLKGSFVVDREYKGKKIGAIAKPIRVIGKSVPSPRPDNFLGGIGNYSIKVDATPNRLRVGDPLTLTLDVTAVDSPTSLEMISAPDLGRIVPLTNDFDVIDKNPVGRIEGNSKVFTYGIRPKTVGVSVPELSFTTFDPRTESFVEIKSRSIPLEIVETKSLQSSDIIGAKSDKSNAIQADKSGIFQGTAQTHPIRIDTPSIPFWAGVAGTSWLGALGIVGFARIRKQSQGDEAKQRRTRAKSIAVQLLSSAKKAMESGDHQQSRLLARQSIAELFANSLHMKSEGLTTADILSKAQNLNLREQDLQSLRELLETIEAGQYGGLGANDSKVLIDRAEDLMPVLSKALQSVSRKTTSSKPLTLAMFVLSLAGASELHAIEPAESFMERANAIVSSIQSANSPEAFSSLAKELEEIRDSGMQGGAIYFHIGNAWFRAGQYGKSIYNYRMAKHYLPNDSYLEENLNQALSVAPGRVSSLGRTLMDQVMFWNAWLSYPVKIQLSATLIAMAALFFVVSMLRKQSKWMAMSVGAMVIGSMLGIEAYLRSPDAFRSRYGVIVSETIARKGMGESSAPAFDQPLKDGAEFEVLQSTTQWTLGHFPGIGDGWVKSEFVIH